MTDARRRAIDIEVAKDPERRFVNDPASPVEDDLTDPNHQDPSPDLPEMLEGSLDEDDQEEEEDGST